MKTFFFPVSVKNDKETLMKPQADYEYNVYEIGCREFHEEIGEWNEDSCEVR